MSFSIFIGDDLLCKEPELPEFMNEIAQKIPMKWKPLGVQLRLDVSDLDRIEAEISHEPSMSRCDTAFIRVFTIWKRARPSAFAWGTLITVLRTRALDEQQLAQEVYSKLNTWYAYV